MKGWGLEATQFGSVILTEYGYHTKGERDTSRLPESVSYGKQIGKQAISLGPGEALTIPSIFLFYIVTPMASKLVSN